MKYLFCVTGRARIEIQIVERTFQTPNQEVTFNFKFWNQTQCAAQSYSWLKDFEKKIKKLYNK